VTLFDYLSELVDYVVPRLCQKASTAVLFHREDIAVHKILTSPSGYIHAVLDMSQPSQSLSQPETLSRPRHVTSKASLAEATSEKATITLIRKTLCPQTVNAYGTSTPPPLHELLPPLTSSNELDLQLYAFVAILIKEFVYVWYSKITSDQVFVDEVVQLVAHSTRILEQRFRQVDVEQVVFDEIPRLIEAHLFGRPSSCSYTALVMAPPFYLRYAN
jgi:hypothetical protein